MYNNSYYGGYTPQNSLDRINNQMAELEKLKAQITQSQQMQQPSINQTFQLAPTSHNNMKYVASVDDVNKEMVIGDTPFFNKDLTNLWIKNAKGEVRTYQLKEIIQKDDKDIEIEKLQLEIKELRKEIENAKPSDNNAYEPTKNEVSTSISVSRTGTKKSK